MSYKPASGSRRWCSGKLLAFLREEYDRGELCWTGGLAHLADPQQFSQFLAPLYAKEWAVYAKPPHNGPEQALKYLARYTYRVAISNERIESLEDDQVTFRYKDYAHGHRLRRMTLTVQEFLRRFMLHVLPRGFVRIRSFGLLANRGRDEQLARCRQLLGCREQGAIAETSELLRIRLRTKTADCVLPAARAHSQATSVRTIVSTYQLSIFIGS